MKFRVIFLLLSISMQLAIVSANAAPIPTETLSKIEAKAAADFPNDYSKQQNVIKAQINAYKGIKGYKNRNLSGKLLEQIKMMAEQEFPSDYVARLSKINQLVKAYIKLDHLTTRSFTGGISKCKNLRWRVAGKGGREFYYWGTLAPGSADVIYLIVRGDVGLISRSFGFPKPDGTWELSIRGDYSVGRTRKEQFRCERY